MFKEHPLIKILDGHPRTIILAASLLERKSLSNIFEDFLNNSKDGVACELIEESLKSSKGAKSLFMFLSMLPTGATESQLRVMLGSDGITVDLNLLVKSSLIVFKTSRIGEPNYQLSFMNQTSQNLLAKQPMMKK